VANPGPWQLKAPARAIAGAFVAHFVGSSKTCDLIGTMRSLRLQLSVGSAIGYVYEHILSAGLFIQLFSQFFFSVM